MTGAGWKWLPCVAALALALACDRPGSRSSPAPAPAASSTAPGTTASSAAAAVSAAADAHAAHVAQGYDCATCHLCAGTFVLDEVVFPRGTTTAGGTISRTEAGTTCAVGCHRPMGAQTPPVSWSAGPLACTACHANVGAIPPEQVRSSHFAGGELGAACADCHDQSQHTRGEVRIVSSDGTVSRGGCTGCHGGTGQTLNGEAGPLLVGWSDAASGDFHGARQGTCRFDRLDAAGQRSIGKGGLACPAGQPQQPGALRLTPKWWYASGTSGPWAWKCDVETLDAAGNRVGPVLTGQPCPAGAVLSNTSCGNPNYPSRCYPTTLVSRGFGGTLRAPFQRGEGPLACSACHDFHASANAFLLASTVNDVALPAGAIDRAGVGAQVLCNACHEGERHAVCKTCHRETWTTDGEYSWFEGEVVDPSPDGAACFYCHGHEGVLHMRDVSPAYPASGHPFGLSGQDKTALQCSHCHSSWKPPATEYLAPAFYPSAPTVSAVTATSATVSWYTTERATSYVEYGVGAAGRVAGDGTFAYSHGVTLTGLTPGATYVWRVRSSDVFQNVSKSALQSFTTPAADAVPSPDLAQVYVGASAGTYSTTAALVWFPVVAPSGTAVEYEIQLASDPAFTHLVNGSIAGPGVPGSTVGDSGWVTGTVTTSGGKPARSFPATITNIPQDDCGEVVPNLYYWRVRARDQAGNVSGWSPTGQFGAFAGDPWC